MAKLSFYLRGFALLFAAQAAAAETTFLLVRHGQTTWNVEERRAGWTDVPLTDEGVKQADALSKQIQAKHPDLKAIYSSDLSRAHSTALPTSKAFRLPIEKRSAFREICWGMGEGMTQAESDIFYKEASPEALRLAPPFEGAETYQNLIDRVQNELKALAEKHPKQKVAVFCHARTIRTLLCEILDTEREHPPSIANCSTVVLRYNSETPDQPFTFLRIENLDSGA